ncbi:aromatic ring-hydroxylating dioxygenase subunit alpha [Spirulina sp. CS-785/01]|uniref:aromatic ring-hydroxylating dioxygenase subunit alpha n=1 Tax=Spirulina sp. CS-785/01 TaxID=3021716 RepID=UPI0023308A68|nr:aromatic ring-hydroxylating dioxygenase subunit alpha [Spirulina sp. CS-785/01]MDB9313968.1 aromatic ring-hydroxylating dioxygenase subunit alpha [Spirulina sp. CS-785/01]
MTEVFNNPHCFIAGWYWVFPSRQLKAGQVKPVTLLGRDLAIYRTPTRTPVAVDAYCPHMGAHLAEGRVEGEGLRCFFHNWKYDTTGECVDIPCLGHSLPVKLKTWPTVDAYGMLWVWVGDSPPQDLPNVPELAGQEYDVVLGSQFEKNCHPNVVLINAIDAHHFNTVHNFPFHIVFDCQEIDENTITFSNTTRGGEESWLVKLLRPFYKNAITYQMCYWYGSTGTVTLGPDFLHFYIMFALRLTEGGKTQGQTILLTQKRQGVGGWLVNRLLLEMTKWVGNYFAKGDTRIFQTIRFNLKTPTPADQSILQFIQHAERQIPLTWETWQPLSDSSANVNHTREVL